MNEWKKVKIGDVCEIIKGATGIASAEPGEYPLVVTAVERKTCSSFQFDCEAVCIPLVSSSGHGKKSLNNVHYQKGKFALGTILCAVVPNNPNELDARFLHQYLQFYKDKILVPLMKGAANVSLSMKDIAKVEIPLPSIEKQHELSELFVEAQKKYKELLEESEKQKSYAKQLRQNILQEAIEGKLTEEWRKENAVVKGNPDFDAEALFEKIQEEKRHTDSELLRNSKKKEKSLPEITEDEKPFEIPEGWKWVRLGEIIKDSPRNGYSPKAVDFETPIKTLKLGAVTYGIFDASEFKYINEEIPKDAHCWLKNGDILIERSNSIEYVGICAIYTGKDDEFMYLDLLMRFRTQDILSKQYIHTALISPFNRSYFMNSAKGAQKTMPKINQDCVVNTMIPLPPLKEQDAIVNKVETLLAKVVELEKQITERETLTKQLIQSIMKDAFREG
ncbi:MAG: restriction endonuclease subunit S [Spirochaetaceae bacterium]|nr:restriction endonuclease subunit S [Spirochaetaceae bacterium]